MRLSKATNASNWPASQVDFLLHVGRAVTLAPPQLPLDPLPQFETDQAAIEQTAGQRGLYSVRVGTDTRRGTVSPGGGHWLERVVAAALVKPGADEVWLNLKEVGVAPRSPGPSWGSKR